MDRYGECCETRAYGDSTLPPREPDAMQSTILSVPDLGTLNPIGGFVDCDDEVHPSSGTRLLSYIPNAAMSTSHIVVDEARVMTTLADPAPEMITEDDLLDVDDEMQQAG